MNKKYLSFIFQFLFSFFFILGIVFIVLGFNDYRIVKFSYKENNDINYKVYLKNNAFFDTEYLGEDRTYIASLIDYLDINYHYNIKYSSPISGDYTYKLVAIVSANKPNSDEYYWKKEYDLSEVKSGTINSSSELSLDENIKINYEKYNQILNNFKKTFAFASEGNLKIAMVVNNNAVTEYDSSPVLISSDINLSIPLLEQTVDASISKDAKSFSNVFEFKQKNIGSNYLIYKLVGIGLTIISLAYFIHIIVYKLFYRRDNEYEVKLNKILKNYDSIIANVNNKPSFNGLKRVEVSNFDELLDVYNEVRMPINYWQNTSKDISTFVIYNDTIVWIYEFKKNDFVEGKK